VSGHKNHKDALEEAGKVLKEGKVGTDLDLSLRGGERA
jgi:hypothetical protein